MPNISTVLFIAAVLIVLFRWWLFGPVKNDMAGFLAGIIVFIAVCVAAAGALFKVAGS